jgi:F-type H+-transporting ATPase subunit delta
VAHKQGQIKIAKSYVSALFSAVTTKKDSDAIIKDIQDIDAMISGATDLQNFIQSPLLSVVDHKAGLEKLTKKAKLSDAVTNMMMVMADNRRLSLLPVVASEVRNFINQQSGTIPVTITTAHKLTAADLKKIANDLKGALGQDVTTEAFIDETLIGGVVIQAGSTLIDGSVKAKLNQLERELTRKAG